MLYGYCLENLNSKLQSVEAIDLIDHTNKIIIQVSATCSKQKIESATKKDILKDYSSYRFKFISISKEANFLRKQTFENPYSLAFSPEEDIYDLSSILKDILAKTAKEQKEIYNFIKNELGGEIDIVKLDSNLATVINVLSKENWDEANQPDFVNSFEIDRKISFNHLTRASDIIKEYCIYYKKVDEKYAEFDTVGLNKSNSVLASIKREYIKANNNGGPDAVFLSVIDSVKNKVLESSNIDTIPIDKLQLPVFLETSVDKNKPIYRRYGFETYFEWENEDGYTIDFMKREPNSV